MGISRGNITTNIIKSGLVFNMDPANRASTIPSTSTLKTFNTINLSQSGSIITDATWTNSTISPAFNFDGSDGYIDAGKSISSLGNSYSKPLTLSIWVNFSNSSNNGIFSISRFNNQQGQIGIVGFTNKIRAYTYGYAFYKEASLTTSGSNWYYIVYSWVPNDNTNSKLYVNGEEKDTGTGNGTSPSSINLDTQNGIDVKTIIGGYYSNVYTFNGNIGPTHIYNRALSAKEVLHNYNALKGRFI